MCFLRRAVLFAFCQGRTQIKTFEGRVLRITDCEGRRDEVTDGWVIVKQGAS
jgi:hypothetical protein